MERKAFLLFLLSFLSQAITAQVIQKVEYKPAYLHDTVFEPGSSIVCDKIRFEAANILITKSSEPYLDSLVRIIKNHKNFDVEISYYQKIWPKDMSTRLPAERAGELKQYLIGKGIPAKRLTTTSTSNLYEVDDKLLDPVNQKGKKYFVEFRLIKNKP